MPINISVPRDAGGLSINEARSRNVPMEAVGEMILNLQTSLNEILEVFQGIKEITKQQLEAGIKAAEDTRNATRAVTEAVRELTVSVNAAKTALLGLGGHQD